MMKKIFLLATLTLTHLNSMAQYSMTAQWNGIGGTANTTFGWESGQSIGISAKYNTYIGTYSGKSGRSGDANTFVGYSSGRDITTGSNNTFLGSLCGANTSAGTSNVFVGSSSGLQNTSGKNNTFLGYSAGNHGNGSGNVFLGYQAGYSETSSNKLYIDNSSTSAPLIWGDFGANRLNFNANVGIGTTTPSYRLHAKGDIYADGGWMRVSGQKGIYFQSYGGGLYMTDAYWIRTYGNKNFYHNTGIMRTDGTFQVGGKGSRFLVNSSGNVGIGTTSPSDRLHVAGNVRMTGNLRRTNHHTGHLEGSYNNVGENSTRSNPIYTIGSNYNPSSTSLGNMYGVGYSHKNASFINSTDLGITPASSWGMYVAADGNARIFLDANQGNGYFKGNLHSHGHVYGRYANNSYSNLYRFGGLYLTWDSDSYGTNTHHSIRSTLGDTYGDDMTINTFDKLRINLDANNNNSDSYFEIGHNTTATANAIFRVQEDGKTGIGTSSPDHKLSVMGRINASTSESNEATESIQLWHTAQEGNIGTSSGELRIRKGEADYLSFKETAAGSEINSYASNLVLKTDGGTGIEIDQEGDVTIKNDLKMTGQFKLDTAFVNEDPQAHQILNMLSDGTIGFRKAETLTPWVVREVLNAEGVAQHVITCDTTLGVACGNGPAIIADLSLYDLNGNIKIGEGAYIDNDTIPGNDGISDDWIRINNSVEVSSSNTVKGFVLRDFDAQEDHFLNFHQKSGISYFSNSNTSVNPEDEGGHFMKAGLDNSVSFPGKVNIPNFSADTLSSSGDLLMVLDSDESEDDGMLRIGTGDPEDGASWKENFNLTSTGIATFSSDIGHAQNPNHAIVNGAIGSGFFTSNIGIGNTETSPAIALDGTTGNLTTIGSVNVGGNATFSLTADFLQQANITGNLNVLGSSNIITGTYGSALDWKTAYDSRVNANQGLTWDPVTKNLDVKLGDGLHINGNGEIASVFKKDGVNQLSYSGSLAIVTTKHSVFALSVGGEVGAEEVIIQDELEWPDYVFEADYQLKSLEETAEYITKYKQLPEVPSALKVAEEGIKVGQMNAILLKKIEELTLHLIAKDQEIEQLKKENRRINDIEQRLLQLEGK